jgi:hypothetical protein
MAAVDELNLTVDLFFKFNNIGPRRKSSFYVPECWKLDDKQLLINFKIVCFRVRDGWTKHNKSPSKILPTIQCSLKNAPHKWHNRHIQTQTHPLDKWYHLAKAGEKKKQVSELWAKEDMQKKLLRQREAALSAWKCNKTTNNNNKGRDIKQELPLTIGIAGKSSSFWAACSSTLLINTLKKKNWSKIMNFFIFYVIYYLNYISNIKPKNCNSPLRGPWTLKQHHPSNCESSLL